MRVGLRERGTHLLQRLLRLSGCCLEIIATLTNGGGNSAFWAVFLHPTSLHSLARWVLGGTIPTNATDMVDQVPQPLAPPRTQLGVERLPSVHGQLDAGLLLLEQFIDLLVQGSVTHTHTLTYTHTHIHTHAYTDTRL